MDNSRSWYSQQIKPSWSPPSWIFGPVWSVLYMIIFSSYGTVFYKVVKGELPWKFALPFVLNLIFNFAFTPLQFGLKNNILALIDVILVWITLVWVMISVWPEIRWVTYANIPYLLWVSFASILQATITFLNR